MYSASLVLDGMKPLMGCLMCHFTNGIGDGIITFSLLLEGEHTLSGAGSIV